VERGDLLALCRMKGAGWQFLAREAQRPGGLVASGFPWTTGEGVRTGG
jgi:hypothetical protein